MNAKETVQHFYSLLLGASVQNADVLAKASFSAIRKQVPTMQVRLEQRWYDSLRSGKADYGVYDCDEYLVEAMHCWWEYSRRYIKACMKPSSLPPLGVWARFANAASIVDLGNGIGFTTSALSKLFPTAKVVGTNMPGSSQYRIAQQLANRDGFTMASDIGSAPYSPDVIWATEYFEHFEQPLQHADEIIETARPKSLLIANTFGGDATGHFNDYIIAGKKVPCKSVARMFNENLRRHGYKKIDTTMWNARPTLWVRAAAR